MTQEHLTKLNVVKRLIRSKVGLSSGLSRALTKFLIKQ